MGDGWSTPCPGRITPGKRLIKHHGQCGRMRKISPQPGSNPRIVQTVANRYTDWAIPAQKYYHRCALKCFVSQKKLLNTKSQVPTLVR